MQQKEGAPKICDSMESTKKPPKNVTAFWSNNSTVGIIP